MVTQAFDLENIHVIVVSKKMRLFHGVWSDNTFKMLYVFSFVCVHTRAHTHTFPHIKVQKDRNQMLKQLCLGGGIMSNSAYKVAFKVSVMILIIFKKRKRNSAMFREKRKRLKNVTKSTVGLSLGWAV